MISVLTDVNERRKAVEALRESEERFSIAFHKSPEMMVIVDEETDTYLEVNDSLCLGTGYTREELIGQHIDKINLSHSPEESKEIRNGQKGDNISKEFHFRKKNGEIAPGCAPTTNSLSAQLCVPWLSPTILLSANS
jgi:PAS domain S-box-containing protein